MQLFIVDILLLLPATVSGLFVRSKGGDSAYTLVQYYDKFCQTEKYQCLELTLDQMTQKNLPEGRSPAVLCDKLEVDPGWKGSFIVHSCPGTEAGGCPANCDDCHEDLVKHFTVDECAGGYMLKHAAAQDLQDAEGNPACSSTNKVDVGLARWCDRWPTAGGKIGKKKNEEAGSGESGGLPGDPEMQELEAPGPGELEAGPDALEASGPYMLMGENCNCGKRIASMGRKGGTTLEKCWELCQNTKGCKSFGVWTEDSKHPKFCAIFDQACEEDTSVVNCQRKKGGGFPRPVNVKGGYYNKVYNRNDDE